MPPHPPAPAPTCPTPELLDEIAQRVLWLSTRIIDHANHDRVNADGLKVGGHQASSASLVTAMTALWFAHLDAADRVSVKPHASPAFHAIQYLLGRLDRSKLTTLRSRGGLQAYPSRTKDVDGVDFSTGSVGLGAAAPLFAAAARRYVDAHFGARPASRFVVLMGDAELDEGNIWEAIADPATHGLGNVMWVVDLNRQSLDRVVPGIRIHQLKAQFEAAGWHVVEVKYGPRLLAAYQRVPQLEQWIDAMPNERYQSLFGLDPAALRERFLDGAPSAVLDHCAGLGDPELAELVTDLGGHDVTAMLQAYAACDAETERPSVVFAYTVKGWGLPTAGHPRNHSALLTRDQIAALRERVGLSEAREWDRLDPTSEAGQWAAVRAEHLRRDPVRTGTPLPVPTTTGLRPTKAMSTQEAFGRILVELSRHEGVGRHLVSTAPDVATSTNLAGFINRMGVFHPSEQHQWSPDPLVKWVEGPGGHHIELGISEMNLFLLLGMLGLSWDHHDQVLLPIGTLYDPFVLRGLDAFVYAAYSKARFVVAGTPSGVTLAPEGGAHQSTITASVGLELPNTTLLEPTYAVALDWLLCHALGKVADPGPADAVGHVEDGCYYVRLTTRALDQAPFEAARERLGELTLHRQVLAGAYRLVDAGQRDGAPVVQLAACGAVMPEVLTAAAELAEEGVLAHVVDVTSADRVYAAWRRTLRQGIRTATTPSIPGAVRAAFDLSAPVVTVQDASSHSLAWLGSALGVPAVPLGVDAFGESGTVADLYEIHDLSAGCIVNAALAALDLARGR